MKTGMPDFRYWVEEIKDRISLILPRGRKFTKPAGKFSFTSFKNNLAQKGGRLGTRAKSGINVPVVAHTVLAILICCGVLVAAGAGLYTVEQKEIHELRADLQAYSDDGVMPATYMNAALALNVEAVAGRVNSLVTEVGDGTDISTEDLQNINLQLIEIEGEAEELSHLIANLHPEESVEKAFSENVQNPLYDVETVIENLIVNNDEISDVSAENGAATDTGSFKINRHQSETSWLIAIVCGAIIIVLVTVFLFRKKLATLFARKQQKVGQKKSGTKEKSGTKGKARRRNGNTETYRRQNGNRQRQAAESVSNAVKFETSQTQVVVETATEEAEPATVTDDVKTSFAESVNLPTEPNNIAAASAADFGEEEFVLFENESKSESKAEIEFEVEDDFEEADTETEYSAIDENDPLSKLAPALRKLAEIERAKSANKHDEGFMAFDENISSLEEVEELDTDDLFAAEETDSKD